jgi:hypothetical protein
MERAIKKVSHGSHQSPQSHFAVPTMEGMALGPSPVRTLASLAAHRADAQKYTGPTTKVGVRQIGEQSYGFAKVTRRRTGRERLLGEGEALYGCLGAGMPTFGTGWRREERQADPHGGRGKVPGRSPECLRSKPECGFVSRGSCSRLHLRSRIQRVTRGGGAAGPHPLERGTAALQGVRLGPVAEGIETKAGMCKKTGG